MKPWLLMTLGVIAMPAMAQTYPERYRDPRMPERGYQERVDPGARPGDRYPDDRYPGERDRGSRDRAAPDGITEMQRERNRRGEPWVPAQNRESRIGDELASEIRDVRGWLMESQRALRRGQLGQANEFLERAETRILTRSTEPVRAGEPMRDGVISYIAAARQALWRRDRREAERQIDMALRAGS